MRHSKVSNGLISVLFSILVVIGSSSSITANQLSVYKDGDSHFWGPSGWMPDGDGIIYEELSAEECGGEREKCIKVGFDAIGAEAAKASQGWAGIYWLPSDGWNGPGINVQEILAIKESDNVKLTFYARGERGGEKIQFKVGGVSDGNDSIGFPKTTGWVTLDKIWKQYEIELSREDLSNVVGGFCWVANVAKNPQRSQEEVIWFYLDDIKFERIVNQDNRREQDICNCTAEKKLALVIGNANYLVGALRNPLNDAQDMTAQLQSLGFKVMKYEDTSLNEMRRAIDDFGQILKDDKYEIGLVFYAGHGIQVKGENYLIPTDAKLQSEHDVEFESVNVGRVLAKMKASTGIANFVILDACRNNPFEREWGRGLEGYGLAHITAMPGYLIAYATSPGKTASDGPRRNGLYTEALLDNIDKSSIICEEMFRMVRLSLIDKSKEFTKVPQNKVLTPQDMDKLQISWESTSLTIPFCFKCE